MIAGPVYQLCNSADITDENKNLLCIVQRSVNRMLRLVNQMMDFHKLENDTLKQKFLRYETTVSRRCFVPSAESMFCGIFARNPPHHEAVH